MSPAVLDRILSRLPKQEDQNVLVGFNTKDDAGVYLLQDDLALVQTTDFFTPIVDDPYAYGQIAAANSLSDIYAMGGRPLTALSVLCYAEDGDLEALERILVGGLDNWYPPLRIRRRRPAGLWNGQVARFFLPAR